MLQEPFTELVCGAYICTVLLSMSHLETVFKESINVNKNSSLPESLQSHCRAVTHVWGLWVYVVMRDVATLEVCLVFPTRAEEKRGRQVNAPTGGCRIQKPLVTPMYHFPWSISWEPACSSPCARSLPFDWSPVSFYRLVSPCSSLNKKILWAGAFFKSDLICACPGHRVLSLSFQPVICCESGHTPSPPQPLAKEIEVHSLEKPLLMLVNPRDQVLNQCGKNHHGNTFLFILKSVVFILRKPCGSEGSTGRKTGCDGLWCSYDTFRGELRSGVGVTASFTQTWWLAGQLSPGPWAGRGRKSRCIRNLCIGVGLKHERSLRQRCPVW